MRRNGGGVGGPTTRRGALLASAGLLLAGCDALDIFGERKVPLPGERHPVLRADRALAADAGLADRAVEVPPPTPLAEWPQPGGRPDHAPGHPVLGTGLRQAWSASAGSGSAYRQRITAGPVVAAGRVFTVDAFGEAACFDLARGSRRWSTDTRPEEEWDGAMGGGAAFADGTLYVATGLAELLALDAEQGNIRWRVRLPAPTRGAPTVAGGRIFVPTIENQLLALSTEDGRRLWTHRAGPIATVPLGMPAPAVEGETVVAGFATGELVALRVADGRVQWTESLSAGAAGSLADIVGIRAMPVADRGRVFAQGLGNVAIAVDLRSGRRLWEREFGGDATPWSAGDWLFAVTATGEALAIGRNDGRIRWLTELTPEGSRASGEVVRWAGPVLAGGRLIICGSGSEALELNPASGEILGRVSLPGPVTLPVAVADGSLVVLTDDGTVAALRPSEG
jgi:outer membrane protein assembly factor BamB